MEQNQIRVLERAVDILDVLRRNGGKARIHQIQKETDLAKSTIFRILNALMTKGYIKKLPDQETYALGYRLIELSFSAVSEWDVVQLAAPFLEQIRDDFNETGALAIKSGIRYSFVSQAACQREYRVNVTLGEHYYLHWAGTGKTMLAYSSPEEIEQICALLPETAVTSNTIRDVNRLKEELSLIKNTRYAYSYSERVEGGASISVPMFNRAGEVQAALSLIAPEIRLRKINIEAAGQKMIEIASQLEHLFQSAGVVLEYCP